uniref:HMA domain-containing protein n=2 Tax=Leersia perrieri TaxID=77586 RepID=A0A0D9VHM7_9ORYZ
MAKKIVIKVNMANDKCRSKAMALVASTGGVVSVELAGDDKSKFVVVGDVDSIKLTNALRKKVDGSAQLVEVGEAKKEEKKKEEEKKKDEPVAVYQPGYYCHPYMYHHPGYGPYGCPCGCNPKPESTCSIILNNAAVCMSASDPDSGVHLSSSNFNLIRPHIAFLFPHKKAAMAKQKIVIKVAMTCDKCRSKAMALVAATGGVDSVALAGDAKDQVVVVGDGVDSIKLTTLLRKKVGHATLVTVGEVKEEEKKKPETPVVVEYPYPWNYHHYPASQHVVYEYPASSGYSWNQRAKGMCERDRQIVGERTRGDRDDPALWK